LLAARAPRKRAGQDILALSAPSASWEAPHDHLLYCFDELTAKVVMWTTNFPVMWTTNFLRNDSSNESPLIADTECVGVDYDDGGACGLSGASLATPTAPWLQQLA